MQNNNPLTNFSNKAGLKNQILAPDFFMIDIKGDEIRLSNYLHKKHVLLILNRGFS